MSWNHLHHTVMWQERFHIIVDPLHVSFRTSRQLLTLQVTRPVYTYLWSKQLQVLSVPNCRLPNVTSVHFGRDARYELELKWLPA